MLLLCQEHKSVVRVKVEELELKEKKLNQKYAKRLKQRQVKKENQQNINQERILVLNVKHQQEFSNLLKNAEVQHYHLKKHKEKHF